MSALAAPRAGVDVAGRRGWYILAAALLALLVWQYATAPVARLEHLAGIDLRIYADAARSWMAGDGFYLERQLAGPYPIVEGDVLYPPTWLVLFVPFTVLPALLWWVVPLGTLAWTLWRLRPGPLGWATIAAFLAWPPTASLLLTGNPGLWLVAALGLATVGHRWAAALLLSKPTVVPFALFGIRDRRWWIAALLLAGASLAFLPMWSDYVRVLLDARHPAGAFYSVQDVPLYCIPLVAWATRRSQAMRTRPQVSTSGGVRPARWNV